MEKEALDKALTRICLMCAPFALGWHPVRVGARILEIARFVALTRSIPLDQRRAIERKAKDFLDELRASGGGGLDRQTLSELTALGQGATERKGRGGDRRSDEHASEASVHRMLVRLYLEANEDGGFSLKGPLPRFVTEACSLLGVSQPSDEAVRKIRANIKDSIRKIAVGPTLATLYGAGNTSGVVQSNSERTI